MSAKKDGRGTMHRMKLYSTSQGVMVAACDDELAGRCLREGKRRLEVAESFYGAEPVSSEALARALCGSTIGNLVGKNTVALASSLELVDEDCVLTIEGVPHAQFVRC